MTTCTRVSRYMSVSRLSSAEEHGAGLRIGPAGQPLESSQQQRRQHEERAGHAADQDARRASAAISARRRGPRQQRQRDVPGVLAERRGRPADVLEPRQLEETPRAGDRRDGNVPRRLSDGAPPRAKPAGLPTIHDGKAQDDPATRLEEGVDALEGGRGVQDMPEDIDHDHRVIVPSLEGKRLKRPLEDGEADLVARIPDVRAGSLHALDSVARLPEMTQEEAAATTDLKDEPTGECG